MHSQFLKNIPFDFYFTRTCINFVKTFYFYIFFIKPCPIFQIRGSIRTQAHIRSQANTRLVSRFFIPRSPFPSSEPARQFTPTSSLHLGKFTYITRCPLTNARHSSLPRTKCTAF